MPKEFMMRRLKQKLIKLALVLGAIFITGFFVEFNLPKLIRGLPAMGDLISRMLKPNFSYLVKILPALIDTIEIAIISSLLGTAASIPFAVLMSRNCNLPKIVPALLSGLFSVLRTIPTLVWAAFLVSMFSVGKFSGLMAVFIIATLIGTRLFREHIDAINPNKIHSLLSTGASNFQLLRYLILPETTSHLLSTFFIILESSIRSSAILGLVGAGGIGQILWKDLNTFRYDNIATIMLVMFLTIYLMDLLSLKMKIIQKLAPKQPKTLKSYLWRKRAAKIAKPLLLVLGIFLIIRTLGIGGERFSLGLKQGGYILSQLFQPDFSYAHKLWQGLSESLAIAVFATILGALISYVSVGLSASNISANKFLSWTMKVLTNVLRTFPPMIAAIVFFRGVGPGPFAGALALSLYTAGVMSKLYTETIENIPMNLIESLQSTGASKLQIYRRGLYPESRATFYGLLLYRLESNIRNSTILGMIGAGGIGTALNMNIQWRNWNRVGILLLGTAIMIIFIDFISREIRKRL